MYVVQISDRNTFAQQAREAARAGSVVSVIQTPGATPVQQGGAVVMHPALTIDYSMEFEDPSMGETRWTFREVVLVDEQGRPIGDNLLKLLPEGPGGVRHLHRSGSL